MACLDTSNEFFMIGVIHRDPDLERLLASWLESVEPDVITLERVQIRN